MDPSSQPLLMENAGTANPSLQGKARAILALIYVLATLPSGWAALGVVAAIKEMTAYYSDLAMFDYIMIRFWVVVSILSWPAVLCLLYCAWMLVTCPPPPAQPACLVPSTGHQLLAHGPHSMMVVTHPAPLQADGRQAGGAATAMGTPLLGSPPAAAGAGGYWPNQRWQAVMLCVLDVYLVALAILAALFFMMVSSMFGGSPGLMGFLLWAMAAGLAVLLIWLHRQVTLPALRALRPAAGCASS